MIQTGKELAEKCVRVAREFRTLYVLGCIGAPLTEANKPRYYSNLAFNRKADRKRKIEAASEDTFGFDCVCLIKALLWGWNGDLRAVYGGAVYASGGVPDIGADAMFARCSGVSGDFSSIEVGEAVWFSGHIGVYVGDGWAVECTHRWNDGVQLTAVHNIGKKTGYPGRFWEKHGKLPYITYEGAVEKVQIPAAFIRQIQAAIGAKVDGIAGPETLSKTVTLSKWCNARHPAVKPVQLRLATLGYSQVGAADGIAGAKFTAAVKAYQRDHGCVVDGVITAGNKTWRRLLGMQ